MDVAGNDMASNDFASTEIAAATRHSVARSTLIGLATWLRETGLDASDGLRAAVDQHAAAVREALGDPEHGPGAVALASYATGVRDVLIEARWQPAQVDRSESDWPTLRLIAICALARSGGHV